MQFRFLSIGVVALATVWAAHVSPAYAGGYEYPGDGVRGMGRGGAVYARADDPSTLLYNPANLANMSGFQLMASANATFFKACANRINPNQTVAPGEDTETRYPSQCNGHRFSPVPMLGLSWRVNKAIGLGFAVFPPNSIKARSWGGTSNATFGTTTTTNPAGDTITIPSPARYMLVEADVIVLYPTIGIGIKPLKWLSFGASFAAGIASFTFSNVIRIQSASVPVTENPAGDARQDFTGQDWFVPRVHASMNLMPHDNLDITFGVRYEDTIRAEGEVEVDYRVLADDEGANPLVGKMKFNAPRPMWVNFGIRYADRITPRPEDPSAVSKLSGRVEDSMSNERWDIELDVVYERNRVVNALDAQAIGLRPTRPNPVFAQLADETGSFNTSVSSRHNWKDQWSIRVGGDWNVIPGLATVRLGTSFETNGFKKGQIMLDYFPMQRYGAHFGLTFRIRNLDVSVAYAHFFHKELNYTIAEAADSAAPVASIVTGVDGEPIEGVPQSAGSYRAHFNIATIGATLHFD